MVIVSKRWVSVHMENMLSDFKDFSDYFSTQPFLDPKNFINSASYDSVLLIHIVQSSNITYPVILSDLINIFFRVDQQNLKSHLRLFRVHTNMSKNIKDRLVLRQYSESLGQKINGLDGKQEVRVATYLCSLIYYF